MKILKVLAACVAAVVAVTFGYRNVMYWRGEVYQNETGDWVPGVSVVLLSGARVVSVSTTDANGEFNMKLGWKRDSTHRVMLCKAGAEPSILFERPKRLARVSRANAKVAIKGRGRGLRARYWLVKANTDFVAPDVERLKAVLPAACR